MACLALLFAFFLQLATAQFLPPEAILQAGYPAGFRAYIPDFPGCQQFAFHGKINNPFTQPNELGSIFQEILRPQDGFWVIQDFKLILTPGDIIHYWTNVVKDGIGYAKHNQTWKVPGQEDSVDILSPIKPQKMKKPSTQGATTLTEKSTPTTVEMTSLTTKSTPTTVQTTTTESTPATTEITSSSTISTPTTAETTPSVTKSTPVTTETTSPSTTPTTTSAETTPSVTKSTPATTETTSPSTTPTTPIAETTPSATKSTLQTTETTSPSPTSTTTTAETTPSVTTLTDKTAETTSSSTTSTPTTVETTPSTSITAPPQTSKTTITTTTVKTTSTEKPPSEKRETPSPPQDKTENSPLPEEVEELTTPFPLGRPLVDEFPEQPPLFPYPGLYPRPFKPMMPSNGPGFEICSNPWNFEERIGETRTQKLERQVAKLQCQLALFQRGYNQLSNTVETELTDLKKLMYGMVSRMASLESVLRSTPFG